MRKSAFIVIFFSLAILLLMLSLVDAGYRRGEAEHLLMLRSAMVAELGLSDLALFTEARFTRHLSLADRHAPFQDHPTSFDHFPSTSLVLPPSHLHR
jgi:hypothetical protein